MVCCMAFSFRSRAIAFKSSPCFATSAPTTRRCFVVSRFGGAKPVDRTCPSKPRTSSPPTIAVAATDVSLGSFSRVSALRIDLEFRPVFPSAFGSLTMPTEL